MWCSYCLHCTGQQQTFIANSWRFSVSSWYFSMDVCQDGKIVCNCCVTFNLVHVSWDLESLVVDQVFCPLLVLEVFDTILGICLYADYLEMWSWQIWNIKLENSHWAQCNLIPFQEFELLCMVKSCVHNCPILVQGFAMFGFHILLWE